MTVKAPKIRWVSCVCGKSAMQETRGMTVTSWRCAFCPPEKPTVVK